MIRDVWLVAKPHHCDRAGYGLASEIANRLIGRFLRSGQSELLPRTGGLDTRRRITIRNHWLHHCYRNWRESDICRQAQVKWVENSRIF